MTKTEQLIRGLELDGWRQGATPRGTGYWAKDLSLKDGGTVPAYCFPGGNGSLRMSVGSPSKTLAKAMPNKAKRLIELGSPQAVGDNLLAELDKA